MKCKDAKRTRFTKNEIVFCDNHAEIILYNNKCIERDRAIIDLQDIETIKKYKWSISNTGNVITTIKNKKVKLHRLILNLNDCNLWCRFLNQSKLDNRRNNLKVVPIIQNEYIRYKDHYILRVTNSKTLTETDVFIDLEDIEKVKNINWQITKHNYVSGKYKNKMIFLHRFILGYGESSTCSHIVRQVDHINGIKIDNRKNNLREVTHKENQQNRGFKKNNSSGYIGVTFDPQRKLWKSYIGGGKGGKQIFLGRFSNIKEAVISRIKGEILYYKEFRNEANEIKFIKEFGDYNFYE